MGKKLNMCFFIIEDNNVIYGTPKIIDGLAVSNAMADIELTEDFEFHPDNKKDEIGSRIVEFLEEILHTAKTGKLPDLPMKGIPALFSSAPGTIPQTIISRINK